MTDNVLELPAETLKRINFAISDPGAFLAREGEDRDGDRIYETVPHWGARAVLTALAENAWIIPRVPHNQYARCGPRIIPNGLVRIEAEDAGPRRLRQLAAQLLAAADQAEQVRQVAPERNAYGLGALDGG